MTISKNRSSDKRSSQLPLFQWADSRQRWNDAGYPAHSLARRYGVSRGRARLLAGLIYDGDKR